MTAPTDPAPAPDPSTADPAMSRSRVRLAVTLLVLLNLFNYIDRYVLPPVFPAIEQEFGVSKAAQGTLATGFLVVYMLASPIFGWAADRYSRWLLVGIGMLIQATGTLGSGLAGTFGMLLLFRCIMGIGDAAYGPAAPTIIAELFPVEKRGRALAWFYTALPVGSALGYAIGGVMRDLTGSWRSGFFVIVPPMILLAIACLTFKDRRGHRAAHVEPHLRPTRADYLALLRNRSFLFNCAGMTALTFAMGGMSYWMPTYLEQSRGLQPGPANFTFGVILATTGLAATLAGGWAGDRFRARYPGSYFLVSGFAMLLAVPLTVLVVFTPMPWGWVVIGLALFFLFFNTGPSNTILANVTLPRVRASAFALNIFIIHTLGDAISPPIIGYLKDHYSFEAGFYLMAAVLLLGGILWLMGSRHLAADTAAVETATGGR
jgi:predicted MFS family arabinose efflux permease